MAINIAIASCAVYLVMFRAKRLSFWQCIGPAVAAIMLSYVPSGAGFDEVRMLAMADERLRFGFSCLLVILAWHIVDSLMYTDDPS